MRLRSKRLDALLLLLKSDAPESRRAALAGIERMSPGGRWPLPRPSSRQVAQVFVAVCKLLRGDREVNVRRAAAYALTFWFERRSPAALLPVLMDAGEDSLVRGQAAEGIGLVLGATEAAPRLRARAVAALRTGLSDPAPEVRFWCLYALGQMQATEARAEIAHIAAHDTALCPHMWHVKDEAADVLAAWDTGVWPERDFV